jgi:predicted GIY-YIG superfamily endonuclease
MGRLLHYVYLLRSISHNDQKYIGVTSDLKQRLAQHNSGQSKHTAKFMPWELIAYHAFRDKTKAYDFERYLKTGSGKAFASKRFW